MTTEQKINHQDEVLRIAVGSLARAARKGHFQTMQMKAETISFSAFAITGDKNLFVPLLAEVNKLPQFNATYPGARP